MCERGSRNAIAYVREMPRQERQAKAKFFCGAAFMSPPTLLAVIAVCVKRQHLLIAPAKSNDSSGAHLAQCPLFHSSTIATSHSHTNKSPDNATLNYYGSRFRMRYTTRTNLFYKICCLVVGPCEY